MQDFDAVLLKTGELATLLDLTSRRVRQLTATGVFRRDSTGKYLAGPSIRAYCESLRGQRADDDERLRGEREGLVRARRLTAELEYAERKRELLPLSEARAAINMAFSLLKAILRGVPTRMAPVLVPIREPARIEDHLEREVDSALHAAADLLQHKGLRIAASAALGRGEVLDVAWLAAQGIPWEPQRPEPVEVAYSGKA